MLDLTHSADDPQLLDVLRTELNAIKHRISEIRSQSTHLEQYLNKITKVSEAGTHATESKEYPSDFRACC